MSSIVYVTPRSPSRGITPYRSLVRHTRPEVEPVSLSEAKAHCRVDDDESNIYLTALIAAAREYVEDRLDTTLLTTVWEARYDAFPNWQILLPRPPMRPDSVTIVYRDEGGQDRTITSAASQFQADHRVTPGRVYPTYQGVWPAVRGDENSVMVRWSAGYGPGAADCPPVAKHACLLLLAHWFANREPVTVGSTAANVPVPYTFETLMASASWGSLR